MNAAAVRDAAQQLTDTEGRRCETMVCSNATEPLLGQQSSHLSD
jgi:hypothetical protein